MGDEDSRTYPVEQCGIRLGVDIQIGRAESWRHLTEILVQSLLVAAELHALEIIGPDAHAETVEPRLLVEDGGNGRGCRAPPRVSPAGLVDEISLETAAQENILEPLAAVRRSFPCLGKLPHAVGEDKRVFPGIDGFLIEHVGVVAVIGAPQ